MDELVQRYEIPNLKDRVETGPVRFNDDWTGVFFRGDNALHYAMLLRYTIENYLKDDIDVLTKMYLEGLAADFESCRHGG